MDKSNKLELHYYFNDSSHTIDAIVRNKCEAELLAVVYEVISELGLHLTIDAEALKEGGIKDIWTVLGKNNVQIAIVISVITLLITQIPNLDSELLDLQKEEIKLSIEEKKISIQEKKLIVEKLKKEVEENNVSQESIESAVESINHNYKVVTRKSNFYKALDHYNKVSQIGVTRLSIDNIPQSEEIIIHKNKFKSFILNSHNLKPITEIDAEIEIVAPVLNEGRAKWKGIYKDEPISFAMNDSDFKYSVLSKRQSFKNGSTIVCVLTINKKLDETGEVIISGYIIDTVLDVIDSGTSKETEQGRKYRYIKKHHDSQMNLFDDHDNNT